MYRFIVVFAALMMWNFSAQAAGVLDWLEPAEVSAPGQKAGVPAPDAAALLTLEAGENEMYAKPSPSGRELLVLSSKRKQTWVSRRFAENGDPANVVTDDVHAQDSAAWHDDGHVFFLSGRAGELGLWEKISDGEGMLKRLLELRGQFTQPILLSDGSAIAVRLSSANPQGKHRAGHRIRKDGFDNWSLAGMRKELVHIGIDGDMRVLYEGVNPSLSPDGQWVAFSKQVGLSYHLFRMHPDGSELVQVTDARSVDVQPSWSPDGHWLLFTSNRGHPEMRNKKKSNWDIWTIDAEGRNLTRLTTDKARDGGAQVGRDGRVYFHSERKVDGDMAKAREVRRVQQGFHIWTMPLPSATVGE
ncbi:MAG: TolB protein [Mariprofundaceae bacterium]|nr:TolB protein [Mariprofundaceae bacterium]